MENTLRLLLCPSNKKQVLIDTLQNWKLSPIKAPNFAGLAPALIVTAELDILRDEAGAYAKKMNDAGSQAELLCIKGVPHPFLMLDDILEGAQEYQAAAMAALNKAFGTPVAK